MRNTCYTKEFHTLTWTNTYMLLFNGLGGFTTMNYSKTLKPNLVGEPYKRKMCSSFDYALILIGCDYSKGNGCATSDMKTQQ